MIYGSRTGNSRSAAILAHEYALFLGLQSELINMEEFHPEDIQFLKNIIIAVSTHGEGDPPVAAEKLLSWLASQETLRMDQARYAILALLPAQRTDKNKKFAFELARSDKQDGDEYRAKVLEKKILNEASPGKKTPDEVQILVGLVDYQQNGRHPGKNLCHP